MALSGKKMKKDSRLAAILDKNLYGGKFFFFSLPYLIIGLTIQLFFLWLNFRYLVIIYLPFFFALVLVSGFATKNFGKEFHLMSLWFAYLLFITSVCTRAFAVVFPFDATLLGFAQFFIVLMVSEVAFVISVIMIVVSGQRASLRKRIGLDDRFFEKGKHTWKNELVGFPNLDRIIQTLDEGQFLASLFEKGVFNLTILWSCNVMAKAIDAIADGIISKTPEKKHLFRTEKGRFRPYPTQLRNLGYTSYQDRNQFNVDTLWHKIRNKIAHHNYRPTFGETKATLELLISFVEEMPNILNN